MIVHSHFLIHANYILQMESDDSTNEHDIDCDDFDIIIIGGGLTGLSAAHSILKKNAGLSVLIIEQNESEGGRLKEGYHGFYAHTFQKHISRYVNEFDLMLSYSEYNDDKQRVVFTKNGPTFYDDLSTIDACQIYYFIKSLHTSSMESQFDKYPKTKLDAQTIANISVNEYLKRTVFTSRARLFCQSMIYGACGVSNLDNISCLWLLVMLHNAGGFFRRFKITMSNNTRFFIKGGMMEIVNHLKDRILKENGVIQCSEVVEKIKYNDFRVWITTSLKTYKCSYVIIAVPPPSSTSIIIEPIMSGNIMTAQRLYHTEKNVYFQAEYKSPFWRPKYVGSIISLMDSGTNLKMVYDASHNEKGVVKQKVNMLAGFLIERTTESTELQNIFLTLNESFQIHSNDNHANKYSQYNEYEVQNPMAVLKPCSIENHINPMLAPLKRVYFAASEYANEFPGTVDGAIEAGEQVACRVLHHVRPQVLNITELMEYIPPRIPPRYKFLDEKDWACVILLVTNVSILFTFLRRAYIS